MMDKFNEMFFQYFTIESFNGDEERMEKARSLFNDLMERYENMNIDSGILNDIDEKMINEESGEFYITDDNKVNLEENIKKLGLELRDVDVMLSDVDEFEDVITVTEYWVNKKGYMMQQNYPLSETIFAIKNAETKKEIISRMIEEDLLNYREHFTYFNFLKDKDRKLFFDVLLNEAISTENYEDAVIFRELLKELN
jgi:hypothetical protein